MSDETDTNQNNDGNESVEELSLENVGDWDAEDLSDGQTTFLQDNIDELTETDVDRFGLERSSSASPPDEDEVEVRGGSEKDDGGKEDKKEDDSDLLPDDKDEIRRIAREEAQSVRDEIVSGSRDDQEVKSFITENPEYKDYESKITKYRKHEAYSKVPIENIAIIATKQDQQKIGAQKERDAQRKASESTTPGTSTRKANGGEKDWSDSKSVSSAEVEEEIANVMGQL